MKCVFATAILLIYYSVYSLEVLVQDHLSSNEVKVILLAPSLAPYGAPYLKTPGDIHPTNPIPSTL